MAGFDAGEGIATRSGRRVGLRTVMFTHHYRNVDEETGTLLGAVSDLQIAQVRRIVTEAGQRFDYESLPDAHHSLHGSEPEGYVRILREWASTLED